MEEFSLPGAGGIIEKVVDNVTYVLVQERFKEDRPQENGLIEIPAGKIRAFENIYDSLRREIREETGLEVIEIVGEKEAQVYDGNGYKVINYTPFSSAQNLIGTYPIMVQVFLCKAVGTLVNRSDESKNLRWIAMAELKRLLEENTDSFYPMHVTALKKYIQMEDPK